jgi:hypothetical protein
MKTKVISALLATFLTMPAFAQHRHHHGHHHHKWNHNYSWVAPAIISGAVVYAVTRPDPIVAQQSVIVHPNQVIIDGVIYTKQIMIINGIQQEVLVRQ